MKKYLQYIHHAAAITLLAYVRMSFVKKMRLVALITFAGIYAGTLDASEMRWILMPAGSNGTCVSNTDGCANVFCYGLEYTPDTTGLMTSYTAVFFIDCISSNSPVISNTSCTLMNSSSEINGCAAYGLIRLNCSGNQGNYAVTAGEPAIIHQVCFSIPPGATSSIMEDEVGDITVAIDILGGDPLTEYPSYVTDTIFHSITVTNTNDTGDGSLRHLIGCAPAGSTITFNSSLMNQTITLTSGEIEISKNLTLQGPGMLNLNISGNNTSRIFHLFPGNNFNITGLTLKDASAVSDGGAIFAEGILTLQNILLQNNFQNGVPKSISVTSTANVTIVGAVEMKN